MCERGADKEARDAIGRTSLLRAGYGHLPVVQYLCRQGADKEARSLRGLTPLSVSAAVVTVLWCVPSDPIVHIYISLLVLLILNTPWELVISYSPSSYQ